MPTDIAAMTQIFDDTTRDILIPPTVIAQLANETDQSAQKVRGYG
jgi:hypothetical protein